jgi:hypothetical protein
LHERALDKIHLKHEKPVNWISWSGGVRNSVGAGTMWFESLTMTKTYYLKPKPSSIGAGTMTGSPQAFHSTSLMAS